MAQGEFLTACEQAVNTAAGRQLGEDEMLDLVTRMESTVARIRAENQGYPWRKPLSVLLMKWRVMMRWRSTSKRETGLSICASCMRTFSVLMPSVNALISPCPLSWWGAMRLWPVPATVRLITCDSCAITTFPVLPMIWKRRAFYLFC